MKHNLVLVTKFLGVDPKLNIKIEDSPSVMLVFKENHGFYPRIWNYCVAIGLDKSFVGGVLPDYSRDEVEDCGDQD